jgi:hypothetical protein
MTEKEAWNEVGILLGYDRTREQEKEREREDLRVEARAIWPSSFSWR